MSRFSLTVASSAFALSHINTNTKEWEWENLLPGQIRFGQRQSFGLPAVQTGLRFFAPDGSYATDFEHDGAWLLRLDMFLIKMDVWDHCTEAIGIVEELMVYPADTDFEAMLEKADWCLPDTCETAHRIGVPYVPPLRKKATGKFAKVRFSYD